MKKFITRIKAMQAVYTVCLIAIILVLLSPVLFLISSTVAYGILLLVSVLLYVVGALYYRDYLETEKALIVPRILGMIIGIAIMLYSMCHIADYAIMIIR